MSSNVVVTGAAGFIGSRLVARLLAEGHSVTGIDNFTDYYSPEIKRRNLAEVISHESFRLMEFDLLSSQAEVAFADTQVVIHLAAQPGVRSSWGRDFEIYTNSNILATQRVLELAKKASVSRFVYASSSSVYGESSSYPTVEDQSLQPVSPYGVSKLAGEHLAVLYARNFGLPTVSLRYHTVFGPGQRPDMAMCRLALCALRGSSFPLYGALDAIRDFTFVDDIVDGTYRAAFQPATSGEVLNLAGGASISMREVIELIESITGSGISLIDHGPTAGDVQRTGGSIDKAKSVLGWSPQIDLENGLRMQIDRLASDVDLYEVP